METFLQALKLIGYRNKNWGTNPSGQLMTEFLKTTGIVYGASVINQ
jgi:hypothetical protein